MATIDVTGRGGHMAGLMMGAAVAVIGGLSLLYWFQDSMIFFPHGPPVWNQKPFAPYEIHIQRGSIQLQGWFVRNQISTDSPLIVYYGGNAEDVSENLLAIDRFGSRSLLLMNYRGYGASGGRPSESIFFSDALHILDTVMSENGIRSEEVVLMGRSLGSGVAVHVASRRQVKGVILVTPFDSLVTVARRHYPFLPVRWMLRHRFDSLSAAPSISCPLLNLIAGRDEVIPRSSSLRLGEAWGGPVQTVVIQEAGHNDIGDFEAYWASIDHFLKQLPGESAEVQGASE
jgi:hypothetical protein